MKRVQVFFCIIQNDVFLMVKKDGVETSGVLIDV